MSRLPRSRRWRPDAGQGLAMLTFRVLGSLGLVHGDGREARSILSQPERTALLAYLATARPGPFHRRDSLLPSQGQPSRPLLARGRRRARQKLPESGPSQAPSVSRVGGDREPRPRRGRDRRWGLQWQVVPGAGSRTVAERPSSPPAFLLREQAVAGSVLSKRRAGSVQRAPRERVMTAPRVLVPRAVRPRWVGSSRQVAGGRAQSDARDR